jgi:hypothetical protein
LRGRFATLGYVSLAIYDFFTKDNYLIMGKNKNLVFVKGKLVILILGLACPP